MGAGIRPVSRGRAAGAAGRPAPPGARPARAVTAAAAVAGMIALHGTDPASVYLSAWARTRAADKAAIEHALYTERTLVRMLGMRRTVFVVPADLVPVIQAACTDQIAERLRRQLTQACRNGHRAPTRRPGSRTVGEATVRALAARGYRDRRGTGPGRAPAAHPDRLRRGQPLRRGGEPHHPAAHAAVRRRAHRARPPARRMDLQPVHLVRRRRPGRLPRPRPGPSWPAGGCPRSARPPCPTCSGGPAGRPGRSSRPWFSCEVTEVDLRRDHRHHAHRRRCPAWTRSPSRPPGWRCCRPWTPPRWAGGTGPGTSGSTRRRCSTGRATSARRSGGTAGSSAAGRNGPDGEIVVRLLEDTGTEAAAAMTAEAQRLRDWIGPGVRVTPRFRTPLERELAGTPW